MKIVLLFGLIVLSSLSVARAYPDGDARNYRNTPFISAHFEINPCIRNLKANLGVILSSDAKTALIADLQSLEMTPGVGWWGIPQGERPIEVNELLIEFLASL
jgi:hypothetical protein